MTTLFSFMKKLVSSSLLSGLEHAVKETMNDAETRAEEIIDHAEERATKVMHKLVKGTIIFFLGLTGLVFALVGLGTYMTETMEGLGNGLGFVFLGAIMILLVGFAKFIEKD